MIGLALVTTVFVVGTSIKRTFSESIDKAVLADFIVSTDSNTGYSPALTAGVTSLPELDAVTGVRFDRFLFNGHERDLVAVDSAAAGQVVDIGVQSGSLSDLGPGSIFIHKDPAHDCRTQGGRHRRGAVRERRPSEAPRRRHLQRRDVGRELPDPHEDVRAVLPGEPARPLHVRPRGARSRHSEGQSRDHDRVGCLSAGEARGSREFRASQEAQLNGLLVAVNGLLALALFIALIGIANTLALSVLERAREIGLLRGWHASPTGTSDGSHRGRDHLDLRCVARRGRRRVFGVATVCRRYLPRPSERWRSRLPRSLAIVVRGGGVRHAGRLAPGPAGGSSRLLAGHSLGVRHSE